MLEKHNLPTTLVQSGSSAKIVCLYYYNSDNFKHEVKNCWKGDTRSYNLCEKN